MKAVGSSVVLTRNPTSRFSADQLADSVRHKGMLSARAVDVNRVEVVFRDPASAAQMAQFGDAMFDLGPFAIESEGPGHVRLRRRGTSRIDVIEIVEVSSADEWRKFLARELDVLSSSPSLYRTEFAEMRSVRLLDIPPSLSAALYFNLRNPALADASVRRRIAAALNREAVARVVTGDAASAAVADVGSGPPETVGLPPRLSLFVVQDESTLLLAANVVRHQLSRLGIEVEVDAVPLADAATRTMSERTQLFLAPLPNGPRALERFVSPGPDGSSVTGFSDKEYDAAVASGDAGRARAILAREMPATVLYEWRTFAAIDSRFCGNVTPSQTSWRWMADLHPCENVAGEAGDTP